MISPAMVNAYHLEHAACVPMLAITDEAYEHFSSHKHRSFYAEEIDPLKLFRRFENLPNGSPKWLLDYVPHCLEAVDGALTLDERIAFRSAGPQEKERLTNQAYRRDVIAWAKWHADAIQKAYVSSSIDSVRIKYRWLADYHDNAVIRFLHDPPPEILIGDLV